VAKGSSHKIIESIGKHVEIVIVCCAAFGFRLSTGVLTDTAENDAD